VLVKQAAAAGITLPLLLPMLAAAQLLAAGGSIFLGRGRRRKEKQASPEAAASFTSILSGSPYMKGIALLVVLIAFVSTLTSFVLKAQVRSTYTHGSDLLGFFAQYYLFLGLLGFLLQISLTRQFLNRFGLVITLAMLPGAVCVFGMIGLLAPALWSMALLRGADEALTNSLFRSGYELLYIPIDPGTKRRFKAIVDLGCDRLGKTLGSGMVSLAIWAFAGASMRALLAVAVVGAMASLIVAVRLRSGYVEALTRSLKSQSVSLDAYALNDATTLCTIAGAGIDIDRDKVVAALGNPHQPGVEDAGMDLAGGEAAMWGTQTMFVPSFKKEAETGARGRPAAQAMEQGDPLVATIADLRSHDLHRIRRALMTSRTLDRHLVSHVITLLGRDDIHRDAARALRKVARTETGQLVDVLLDPGADPTVRRRLPHVLEACGSQMAVDGLFRALEDPVFEVRFRAAGGLVRIREAHPELVTPREAVFEAAVGEIRRGTGEGDARVLDLVFRILSLALEPEPLRLAHQAFRTDDTHLRGTALEYLETVLQESVLQELRPLVGASRRQPAPSRSEAELKSELLASSAAVSIDVASLRRKLRGDDPAGLRDGGATDD